MPIKRATKSKSLIGDAWVEPVRKDKIWRRAFNQHKLKVPKMSAEQLRDWLFSRVKEPDHELRRIGYILVQNNIDGQALMKRMSFYDGNAWIVAKDVYYHPLNVVPHDIKQANFSSIIEGRKIKAIGAMADLVFIANQTSLNTKNRGTQANLRKRKANEQADVASNGHNQRRKKKARRASASVKVERSDGT